jgi:hypothetical protein
LNKFWCSPAWGYGPFGGTGEPSDNGYTKVYSTYGAFAALKGDGSIRVSRRNAGRPRKKIDEQMTL